MSLYKLIYGCQSITAGSSLRASLRLIDCAIDYGVTSFDVAPSYGMGTAESVIGLATAGRSGVRITTKVGIEPPKLGWMKSWFREPYRAARGALSPFVRSAAVTQSSSHTFETRHVDVLKSLRRSKAALRRDHIDTWLTHEALGDRTLVDFVSLSRVEAESGNLEKCGFSGEIRSIAWNARHLSLVDPVIQCALGDIGSVPRSLDIRLFAIVRTLSPHVTKLFDTNAIYAGELRESLGTKSLLGRDVFVSSVAAAMSMAPDASIVFSTANETTLAATLDHIGQNRLSAWAERHRERHASLVWGIPCKDVP